MTTIVEALQNAADALNNAVTSVLGIRDKLAQQATAAVSQTSTIINNFLTRPAITTVYCDPINGSDDNDGATLATARKSIDAIVISMGSIATQILLLNDAQIKNFLGVNAPLFITGVQQSAVAPGYIYLRRTISFLGTALNSPLAGVGTACAGFLIGGPSVRFSYIDFTLPDVPNGLNYRSHFTATVGCSMSFDTFNLTVASAQAGALIGYFVARVTATLSPVLGVNAPGHLFSGIASGGNPNSSYYYTSNITSA